MSRRRRRSRSCLESLEPRRFLTTTSFEVQVVFQQEIWEPDDLAPGDFDGDGDYDVAVGTEDGMLIWFENEDGRGGFGTKHLIDLDDHQSIRVADINADGRDDLLAVTDRGVGSLYRNLGESSFERLDVIEQAFEVRNADLDADGDLDLIFATHDGSYEKVTLVWVENLGLHNEGLQFAEPAELLTKSGWVRDIQLADVDGDSRLDMLVRGWSELYLLRGKEGASTPVGDVELLWTQDPQSSWLKDFSLGDVDQDGSAELAMVFSDKLSVISLDDEASTIEFDVDEQYWDHVRWNDVDVDGDLDLWLADESDEVRVGWIENRGESQWGEYRSIGGYSLLDLEDGILSREGADFDQDGDLDYAWASEESELMAWQATDLETPSMSLIPPEPIEPSNQQLVDFDDDGDLDIITGSLPIGWFENLDGRGEFGPFHQLLPMTSEPLDLQVLDVDDDGDFDLLVELFGRGVVFFENLGDATFGEGEELFAKLEYGWLTSFATTKSNEGKFDSIVSLADGTETQQLGYRQFSDGEFAAFQVIAELPVDRDDPDFAFIHEISSADLNGDGIQDVAAIFAAGDRAHSDVRVFLGVGETFVASGSYRIGNGHYLSLELADMNADGRIDVVASDQQQITWLENNGNAVFDSPPTTYDVNSYDRVVAYDLDGDNDADIIPESTQLWLENVAGSLVEHNIAEYINSVGAVGDINQDGRLDFVASGSGRSVFWFENRLVGDVNRDGRFDSSDLVDVMAAGWYEQIHSTGQVGFDNGDWNRDGQFNSTDFVYAMTAGHYV